MGRAGNELSFAFPAAVAPLVHKLWCLGESRNNQNNAKSGKLYI